MKVKKQLTVLEWRRTELRSVERVCRVAPHSDVFVWILADILEFGKIEVWVNVGKLRVPALTGSSRQSSVYR